MSINDVAAARSDYMQASELADRLASADPESAVASRFQSMTAEVLADLAIADRQFDEALRHATRSLDMSLELLNKDPQDGQMARDVMICQLKVAKVQLNRKEYQLTKDYLAMALLLAEEECSRREAAWGHTQTTILNSYSQSRPEMKLTANKKLRRRTPPMTESGRISPCSARSNLKRRLVDVRNTDE